MDSLLLNEIEATEEDIRLVKRIRIGTSNVEETAAMESTSPNANNDTNMASQTTHRVTVKNNYSTCTNLGNQLYKVIQVNKNGDLNFHLNDNTYSSTSSSSSGDGLVNSIIQQAGLEDMGFIVREHTWSSNNKGTGSRRSRIDMALVNAHWSNQLQDSKLLHLSQNGSDHCPIMLVTDYSQPKLWKPFKFFCIWLQDRMCKEEITKAWDISVQGSAAHKFTMRLHFTRRALSKWNKEHFGDINKNVDNFQQQLDEIQAQPFSRENTAKAEEISKELDKWHQIQNDFNKKKSRDNFIK
ncbi:uncharacterized protein LOC113330470 [Papaver somniferum]|uniref:uncharacterized protein LOC113330470 n=1 Tax=Papaver somniferum TaxID=3469 RepID=UPI000E6FC189|nr:uncharacterized protein LOC113330470 [Papaver somniferum]